MIVLPFAVVAVATSGDARATDVWRRERGFWTRVFPGGVQRRLGSAGVLMGGGRETGLFIFIGNGFVRRRRIVRVIASDVER